MPKKNSTRTRAYKRTRKYTRRPRYVRRHRGYKAIGRMLTRNVPMPDKFITSTKLVSTPGGWQPASYTNTFYLKLNDIIDPLGSFGSEHPKGLSDLDNFYSRYYVFGGSYRITLMNQTAVPCQVAALVLAETTAPSVFRQAAEAGRTWLIPATDDPASNKVVIRGRWRARTLVDVRREYGLLSAQTDSTPSRIVALHLFGRSIDGSTQMNLAACIEMHFNILLSDRIQHNVA